MNDPLPLPPPSPAPLPDLYLKTTTQVLKRATSIFLAHLLTFLLMAFLILTFRSNVENGTNILTGVIDRDPFLRSLLSNLDISGKNPQTQSPSDAVHHHHRRPFLHLTRVGTLDDDFFSGDEDRDRTLFRSHVKSPTNGTSLIFGDFGPRLGFSNYSMDNGIRVSEVVHSGMGFKLHDTKLQSLESVDEHNAKDGLNEVKDELKQGEDEAEIFVSFQFLLKGLELRRHDGSALVFLIFLLSVAYGYVIIGYLVTYSWVLGIVFIMVVRHLLRKDRSWAGTLWDGSNMGLRRLSGLILMKWAVRDAVTQLLGLWFFGEIEDQYSFFKIFVRLKLMPFSIMSPWIRGFEKETAGFLFVWLLLDTIVEFVFSVDAWVAIVDARKSGREIVKEGCYLLSTMFKQAIIIKCLESMICGSFTRWTMARYFGRFFVMAFQSTVEVYFMVVWLVYYFAVRSKDATSLGRTFGWRDLEGYIQGRR